MVPGRQFPWIRTNREPQIPKRDMTHTTIKKVQSRWQKFRANINTH